MKPRLHPSLSQSLRRPTASRLTTASPFLTPSSSSSSPLTAKPHQFLPALTLSRTTIRTLIAAPNDNDGPILSRRPDRELPDTSSATRRWLVTLPVFVLMIGASAAAIFNYEKSSSSVVSATLYSLRTHPRARELLGDEIYFRDRWPWVWGELNMVQGRVDIGYGVKGTKGKGYMTFVAERPTRNGLFTTREWNLVMEGSVGEGQGEGQGEVIRLLDSADPFAAEVQGAA